MASRPGSDNPWPTPTPSLHRPSVKRKRPADDPPPRRHVSRQLPTPATVNNNNCGLVADNSVFSCFPTSDAIVVQDIPTRLVWNTNVPIFSQTRMIDVYLMHGDTDERVLVWKNVFYPQGHLATTPNDTWWGARGANLRELNKNQTQTFFFLMAVNGTDPLSATPQTTFTATQTQPLPSVLASISSASLSSLSAAAAASSSLTSLTSVITGFTTTLSSSVPSQGPNGGSLQGNSSSDDFPHWAIALLAVLGFLALVAFTIFFWLLIRHLRRKHARQRDAQRNSIGSQSPMIQHDPTTAAGSVSHGHGGGAPSPTTAESGMGPLPAIAVTGAQGRVVSDGASTISRADSAGGPFSAVDAAAMAAAFRNVMRKPDFAGRPMEEGESPEQEAALHAEGHDEDEETRLMKEEEERRIRGELAEEGRDIRSVSSGRGVRIERLSGETGYE